jgi:hypothetical protein
MIIRDLFHTFSILKDDRLCFIYQGDFKDEITAKIINLSEYNIENTAEISKMKKKVSLIMVECFQNIVRHGEDVDKSKLPRTTTKSRIFIARNIKNSYIITSANLIENENISSLQNKIDTINGFSKEELKDYYMEILSNEELTKKGGAGLGLVEMARKSGEKLDYSFESLNDKLSYFYLQSNIHNNVDEKVIVPLSIAKDFHKKVISWNILMIYKGDFSQSSIMPVLRMIENNMSNQLEELRVKKVIYLALVETLQNILKHSKSINGLQEGVFFMGKKDRQYVIASGNLIDKSEVSLLKSHLETVISLSKEELTDLYKKTLISGQETYKGGAGLGLIDIARESSEKLEYEFVPFNDELMFFSLIVRI